MANVKITDLTAGTALGGSELFEAVQSSTSVKISATQVKNFIAESLALTAGSIPFNTITNRAYGQFESLRDQSAVSANVAYIASFDSAASFNSGVSVASSTNITVAAAGVYLITTSVQFYNANTADHYATFWFRKNGATNINNSGSIVTVPKAADGGHMMTEISIMQNFAASDYIQLMWQVDDIDVRLDYSAASGSIPAVPAVIFNINRIA